MKAWIRLPDDKTLQSVAIAIHNKQVPSRLAGTSDCATEDTWLQDENAAAPRSDITVDDERVPHQARAVYRAQDSSAMRDGALSTHDVFVWILSASVAPMWDSNNDPLDGRNSEVNIHTSHPIMLCFSPALHPDARTLVTFQISIMNKTQFYLSQCAEAAAKSSMCFTLGAVLVKGGKVISSGYNHHRPHYDGAEALTRGHRKPVSMHAEMHAIFNLTGMSPSFRKQVQGVERRLTCCKQPQHRAKGSRRFSRKHLSPLGKKRKNNRGVRSSERRNHRHLAATITGDGGSAVVVARGYESERNYHKPSRVSCTVEYPGKGWDSRRRDSRVNGADIYVARITKNGTGNAKPCWRCLEWCRWAGVKRVFHWNSESEKFDVVKVNSAERDQYETHADGRLYAGLGW
ncbi:hypothetical protein GLOTRDRAFT_93474 [Gloeophyllum trabeum ATCC 11539]|uniref:CMP/dCMP-type deaminase domain-containing protein n=1 Tax=Gloeophyllum trabeum (strain ATCC 11539 / FP-39264 / Madison 617) TaxID=670483 RepID=S7RSG5_GLOTA|nr:uncharacterized protein GLOTRDRAFT_93474 [Gloeophyllum trabeum ATCC 11539]EPQ55964.1 hypothetical protein GLOTRDRAFT_93474 [Gloeophyllum trabeum ATCC 11539]